MRWRRRWRDADSVVFLQRPGLPWDSDTVTRAMDGPRRGASIVDALLETLSAQVRPGDHVVFMSNGGFEDAPRRFVDALRAETGISGDALRRRHWLHSQHGPTVDP